MTEPVGGVTESLVMGSARGSQKFGLVPLIASLALGGCGAASRSTADTESGKGGALSPKDGGPAAAGAPTIGPLPPPGFLGGPETCFDAVDDNENGLIDEGCDTRQGQIAFSLAWTQAEVDVNLAVVDPDGELVPRAGATGLGLTGTEDCPGDGRACRGRNLELVYLEGEELPFGRYVARVRLGFVPEPSDAVDQPIEATLGVQFPGVARSYRVLLARSGEEVGLSVELTEAGLGPAELFVYPLDAPLSGRRVSAELTSSP